MCRPDAGGAGEMKAMWTEQVRPRLLARQNCTLHSLTLRVLGARAKSNTGCGSCCQNQNPPAAIYCKTGESEIPDHRPGRQRPGRGGHVPGVCQKVL